MFINTKLTTCEGCEGVETTIAELDCFIADSGRKHLNSKRYALGKKIKENKMKKAIRYKNILLKRMLNPGYLSSYNILDIINKAKQLTY